MGDHFAATKRRKGSAKAILLTAAALILAGAITFYLVWTEKQNDYIISILTEAKALKKAEDIFIENRQIYSLTEQTLEKKIEKERLAEEARKAEEARIAAEKKKAEEAARIAEEKRKAAEAKIKAEQARRDAELKAAAEKAKRAEAERAAAEKARLASEQNKRSSLSAKLKQQEIALAKEQQEYYQATPTPTVELPVENILQNPELPNGCEITATTILINYLGYPFDKCTLADYYLPQVEFIDINGQRTGGNPDIVYCGNPRFKSGGYYCFTPPLVDACNAILAEVDSPMRAEDITGASEQDLLSQLDQGRPVVAFTTLSMGEAVTYEPSSWVIMGEGTKHTPFLNLHCVVLYGYDDTYIYVADPLKGKIQCKRSTFMSAYKSIGSRALVVY